MKKLLSLVALLAALLALSTGTAFAQEGTPITGTVESVVPQTDETSGETIYVVTLTDEFGESHVFNLSPETAEALGLISVDEATGEVTINEVTDPITVNPEDVLPGEEPGEEEPGDEEPEAQHPVGSKLGEFFGELLGVDYDAIMEQKEQGFGFGVIAQALWLTSQVDGDTETFTALLEAKKSGDYSDIVLADGSTPDNWGDVVKSLKKGDNLGSVMSGRADSGAEDEEGEAETQSANEKGNGKGNAGGNGNSGNGNGGNNGNGNKGNGGDNGKGNNGGGNGKGNGKGKP